MLHCRACGAEVVSEAEAKAVIRREYRYSDAELEKLGVRVWHTKCAVADGRIDPGDEDDPSVVPDGFVWSVVPY